MFQAYPIGLCFRPIFKFADDTYLVVPGVITDTCQEEIDHIQTWAADNSLKLNRNKTKEIGFSSRREGAPPPSRPDIERMTSLRVLGVIVNDKLTAADHVTMLLSLCSSLLYAMRVLRSEQGMDRWVMGHGSLGVDP